MTERSASAAQVFRGLHDHGLLVLPNAWDAGSARLIESVGALRRGDLAGNAQRLVEWERAAGDPPGEGLAVHELHHEVMDRRARAGLALLFADLVDHGDADVAERGEEACLTLETSEAVRVAGEAIGQDLDGDVAAQARVACAIHLAHFPGADSAEELVGSQALPGGQAQERSFVMELVGRILTRRS